MTGITEADVRRICPTATIRGGAGPETKTEDREQRAWSNARKTIWKGFVFASKTEARVYQRLLEVFEGCRIRRQARMPLLAGNTPTGVPLYLTVDFVVIRDGTPICWIDAKTRRKSREWLRGATMFAASWGRIIEWDGKGEMPESVAILR